MGMKNRLRLGGWDGGGGEYASFEDSGKQLEGQNPREKNPAPDAAEPARELRQRSLFSCKARLRRLIARPRSKKRGMCEKKYG